MPEQTPQDFHPVAGLFPLLEGPAFEDLTADIRKNGLLEPILIDPEGRIVDGRNRYRACLAAGVEPRFVQHQTNSPLPELALSLNLHRRHLDESQRAMVAARLAKLLEKDAAQRRGARTDIMANLPTSSFGPVRQKASTLVNVSPRIIGHAIKVLRDGCPDLVRAVDSSTIAVSTASVLAALPPEEQQQVLTAGPKAVARKCRELRTGKPNSVAAPPRPAFGSFGLVTVDPHGPRPEPDRQLALLWFSSPDLDTAIATLKSNGFRYTRSKAKLVI